MLLSVVLTAFGLSGPHHSAEDNKIDNYHEEEYARSNVGPMSSVGVGEGAVVRQ